MALFNKTKNYMTIVAPLKKMVDNLKGYINEQKASISRLNQNKREIEKSITESDSEIVRSEFTAVKIQELIGINNVEEDLPAADDTAE